MADDPWHFDKRIPLALIFTILAQGALAVWWASTLSQDVFTLKERQDRQEATIEVMRTTANAQAVQLGRIEENTRATASAVERLIQQMVSKP